MRDLLARAAPGPALVRLCAVVAALGTLLAALPIPLWGGPGLGVVVGLALGVGLAPRTRWVTLVLLVAVVGWLIDTIAYATPPALWRLTLLAAGMYLTHTGAALAAVLPYDTQISLGVLAGWARRAVAVVGASLVISVCALLVVARLPGWGSVAVPLVGLLAAGALVVVFTRL